MEAAHVVIGANYGDEGKGLITDYLCHKHKAGVVVRFNGGAQAGHTVVTPDGRRHVFGHIGSGTFAGAASFLSKHFVINPLLFFKERGKLVALGLHETPGIIADPRCPVTTPYDILINQAIETRRGGARHGSCGVGFGETLQRCQFERYSLRFMDLMDQVLLENKLDAIFSEYVPMRLQELGLIEADLPDILPNTIDRFIEDCRAMTTQVVMASPAILNRFRHVVFEGAQGLMLDQDYGTFPHVTRSNTGLKNVREILSEAMGRNPIHPEVIYVTRPYLTRHGAGPLPGEVPELENIAVEDETNRPNPFQGALRFARLDIATLSRAIWKDYGYDNGGLRPRLAVTCLDQVKGPINPLSGIWSFRDGTRALEEFAEGLAMAIGIRDNVIESWGPTRDTVKE